MSRPVRHTACFPPRPAASSPRARADRLRDERGASLVIALVFFLICAIVGSVVLTAASVGAKAVQTNRELQQAEFTVGSAAQLVGSQFSAMGLTVDYASSADGTVKVDDATNAPFGFSFWEAYGTQIWSARTSSGSFTQNVQVDLSGSSASMDQVVGAVTVDADLNITVDLGRFVPDSSAADANAYRERVYVQCVPTYDRSGRLVAFTYEPAVITKDVQGGGA